MGERPNRNYEIGCVENKRGRFVPFVRVRGRIGTEYGSGDGMTSSVRANYAAAIHLVRILNARTRSRRKHGYSRFTGEELSSALHDFDMTPTEFAILYGTTLDRVLMWIDNADTIPHPVRVMLAMFEVPGALERAREETRAATGQDEEEEWDG